MNLAEDDSCIDELVELATLITVLDNAAAHVEQDGVSEVFLAVVSCLMLSFQKSDRRIDYEVLRMIGVDIAAVSATAPPWSTPGINCPKAAAIQDRDQSVTLGRAVQ